MIPVKLGLSNFMSYAEGSPPVDFSGFHIACLSGENGHGKSALLDAITWVLWGEARAHADSLVRLGQQEMRVEFEFLVDGVRYVVIRRRSQRGTGTTRTDLYVVTEDGEYRAQSGQGERATQEKINQVLRMDYRAFINSAFILQGRTDEFTRQNPAERKKILGEILSLGRYDTLETMARERQRVAEDRGRTLQGELDTLGREIVRKAEYGESLTRAELDLSSARESLTTCQQELDRTQTQLVALGARASLLESLQARRDAAVQGVERARQRLEELQARLAALEQKLASRNIVEQKRAQLVIVRRDLEAMDRSQGQYLEADRAERQLETALAERRHAIELRLSSAELHLKDLARRGGEVRRIRDAIATLQKAHRHSDDLDRELEKLREDRDARAQQIQCAVADMGALDRELERLEHRRSLLSHPSAACPLCTQPLGDDHHARLLAEVEEDDAALKVQYQDLEAIGAAAEVALKTVTQQARDVRQKLDAARKAEQQVALLEQALVDAEKAAAEVPGVQQQIAGVRAELSGEIDPELNARMKEARAAKESSGYRPEQHDSLRVRVRSLEFVEREHQELEFAAATRTDTLAQIQEMDELRRRQEETAGSLHAQIAELAGVPGQKRELEIALQQLSSQRDQIERVSAGAQEEVGRWRTMVERCLVMEEQQQEKRQEMAWSSKDAAIYKELASAFGKKGIQAMIIENVVPEIEAEANRLLSLMADNGMRIQFRTQRELKKGGGAETLDIVIDDQVGERPYECYSGGESFRINFAIRIALSRLLSRRAGAQLQTIVIDEGFGTQDTQGRKRLLEVIESVKDEFARIIVITHLDDIKDEFPARLHVSKDENGSRVTVLA